MTGVPQRVRAHPFRLVLALAFVFSFGVTSTVGIATASVAAHWPNRWDDQFNEVANYRIDSSRNYPFASGGAPVGSDFYYRAKDAAAKWTAVSNSTYGDPDYVRQSQVSMAYSLHNSPGSVPSGYVYIMDYWSSS